MSQWTCPLKKKHKPLIDKSVCYLINKYALNDVMFLFHIILIISKTLIIMSYYYFYLYHYFYYYNYNLAIYLLAHNIILHKLIWIIAK